MMDRLGQVTVLEPGEEGDKLVASEGCRWRVVLEEALKLL
jgi:hypothetical protein